MCECSLVNNAMVNMENKFIIIVCSNKTKCCGICSHNLLVWCAWKRKKCVLTAHNWKVPIFSAPMIFSTINNCADNDFCISNGKLKSVPINYVFRLFNDLNANFSLYFFPQSLSPRPPSSNHLPFTMDAFE